MDRTQEFEGKSAPLEKILTPETAPLLNHVHITVHPGSTWLAETAREMMLEKGWHGLLYNGSVWEKVERKDLPNTDEPYKVGPYGHIYITKNLPFEYYPYEHAKASGVPEGDFRQGWNYINEAEKNYFGKIPFPDKHLDVMRAASIATVCRLDEVYMQVLKYGLEREGLYKPWKDLMPLYSDAGLSPDQCNRNAWQPMEILPAMIMIGGMVDFESDDIDPGMIVNLSACGNGRYIVEKFDKRYSQPTPDEETLVSLMEQHFTDHHI